MLSAIVALAKNRAIGKENKLLWHISEDLRRFKTITSGHTIIMGRKTFESLPSILPNRHHIVLTKDKNYKIENSDITIVHSIGELLPLLTNPEEEYFVIGGAQIYKKLLPLCDKLYLTQIHQEFEGDSFFPLFSMEEWEIVEESEIMIEKKTSIPYTFITLQRSLLN
jgi:dihydrofolate reductase